MALQPAHKIVFNVHKEFHQKVGIAIAMGESVAHANSLVIVFVVDCAFGLKAYVHTLRPIVWLSLQAGRWPSSLFSSGDWLPKS